MKSIVSFLDQYFKISSQGSSFWVETRAGITTFLTMAYILFVNPSILGSAIKLDATNGFGQLMTATAIAAAIGTLCMGLLARYPFALAPGMGQNAFFAFTVVLVGGVAWQTALGAVFISGILFLALSILGLRETVIKAIPNSLKQATAAGIGFFLAIIGCQNAGLIQDSPATLVTLGNLTESAPILSLAGILIIGALLALRVRGAILIGIMVITVAAMLTHSSVFAGQKPFEGFVNGIVASPAWPTDLFLSLDIMGAMKIEMIGIVLTLLFVDLFDTAGTLIGLSGKAGYLDQDGNLPRASLAFTADALATSVGAVVGTSSTTSYIESAAGIEDGGRTGFTSVVVGILFLLSLFFWPLAGAVPAVATAPALIIVGAMMMGATLRVDWMDYRVSIPAFLTIVMMPLTYSIANGIAFGIVSYTLIHLFSGRYKSVHWLMYLLSALLILKFSL